MIFTPSLIVFWIFYALFDIFRFVLWYFISFLHFSFRFVLWYFISFRFVSSFFVLFRCISFRFVSFRFVSFLSLVVPVRQPLPPSFYHVYHETKDVASVVLFVNWLECFRDIWAVLETKETLLLVPQDSCCKIIWDWPFTLNGAMSHFFAVEFFFSDATKIIFSYFPAKCQSN